MSVWNRLHCPALGRPTERRVFTCGDIESFMRSANLNSTSKNVPEKPNSSQGFFFSLSLSLSLILFFYCDYSASLDGYHLFLGFFFVFVFFFIAGRLPNSIRRRMTGHIALCAVAVRDEFIRPQGWTALHGHGS